MMCCPNGLPFPPKYLDTGSILIKKRRKKTLEEGHISQKLQKNYKISCSEVGTP